MNHYKICVYGICKDEEQFAKRCMDSIKEADVIVMLDTGSTDNTVEILKSCGAIVHSQVIDPWRFDVPRNLCLELIPEDVDICISIDLDEILVPGWREALEKVWEAETNRASYLYIWSFNEDGSPAVQFYQERIHARHNYRWIYPTHEVLEYLGEGEQRWCNPKGFIVKHYPDYNKARNFNLGLLELAVQENPESVRNTFYLGREYYFVGYWQKCIDILSKYLAMPEANWKEERSFAMRYIANSYTNLDNHLEAKSWLLKAMAEAPYMREPYVEMCRLAYKDQDWKLICLMSKLALYINKQIGTHYNEAFAWNETVYDLAALGYYYEGEYEIAHIYIKEALKLAPTNIRLQENLNLIEQALKR